MSTPSVRTHAFSNFEAYEIPYGDPSNNGKLNTYDGFEFDGAGTLTVPHISCPDVTSVGTVAQAALDAVMKHVSIPVTAAQIKAAYATPLQAVAAPGAGFALLHHGSMFQFKYGSVPMTGGGDTLLQYDSTAHGAGTKVGDISIDDSTIINGTANANVGIAAKGVSPIVSNKGIFFSNKTAAYAAGDSTGTLDVWYSVVTVN